MKPIDRPQEEALGSLSQGKNPAKSREQMGQKPGDAVAKESWALMSAIWSQDEEGVKAALARGASAEFEEQAPLRAAISVGHAQIAGLLLAHGAKGDLALGRATLGRGSEELIEAMAHGGGFDGWNGEAFLMEMGRSDWVQKIHQRRPLTADKAHRLLEALLKGPDASLATESFIEFLCDAGAKPWQDKDPAKATSRQGWEPNCLAMGLASRSERSREWFPALAPLVRKADRGSVPDLAKLLTNWELWTPIGKKAQNPAFVTKKITELSEDGPKIFAAAMADAVCNNSGALGRMLFKLGAGEAGIACVAQKAGGERKDFPHDWWTDINTAAKWSADSKATFAANLFLGAKPLNANEIEKWLTDAETNKLHCADALWDMAHQWLQKHPGSTLGENPKMAKLLARHESEQLEKIVKAADAATPEPSGHKKALRV